MSPRMKHVHVGEAHRRLAATCRTLFVGVMRRQYGVSPSFTEAEAASIMNHRVETWPVYDRHGTDREQQNAVNGMAAFRGGLIQLYKGMQQRPTAAAANTMAITQSVTDVTSSSSEDDDDGISPAQRRARRRQQLEACRPADVFAWLAGNAGSNALAAAPDTARHMNQQACMQHQGPIQQQAVMPVAAAAAGGAIRSSIQQSGLQHQQPEPQQQQALAGTAAACTTGQLPCLQNHGPQVPAQQLQHQHMHQRVMAPLASSSSSLCSALPHHDRQSPVLAAPQVSHQVINRSNIRGPNQQCSMLQTSAARLETAGVAGSMVPEVLPSRERQLQATRHMLEKVGVGLARLMQRRLRQKRLCHRHTDPTHGSVGPQQLLQRQQQQQQQLEASNVNSQVLSGKHQIEVTKRFVKCTATIQLVHLCGLLMLAFKLPKGCDGMLLMYICPDLHHSSVAVLCCRTLLITVCSATSTRHGSGWSQPAICPPINPAAYNRSPAASGHSAAAIF